MAKRGERVTIVGTDVGGVRHATIHHAKRENYTFGAFMIASFDGYYAIRRAGLNAAQRLVLDALMLRIEFGNAAVGLDMEVMADELAMSASYLYRCIVKLESCDFVFRGVIGVVYLNPNYWFKGTAKEQQASVFKWHQMKQKRRSAA